jgi:hypothetical protein
VCWTIEISSVTVIVNPYNKALHQMLQMVTSIPDRISAEISNQKTLGSGCVGSAVSIAA